MKFLCAIVLACLLVYSAKVRAQSISSQTTDQEIQEGSNVTAFENLIILDDLLDVFDIRSIGLNWNNVYKLLTSNCSRDMKEYLRGLQAGKIWAIKSKWSVHFFLLNNKRCNEKLLLANYLSCVDWITFNDVICAFQFFIHFAKTVLTMGNILNLDYLDFRHKNVISHVFVIAI